MLDEKLIRLIEAQISAHDVYSGGQIEDLESQVNSLLTTVAVLATILFDQKLVTIETLNDLLPSYGSGCINTYKEEI